MLRNNFLLDWGGGVAEGAGECTEFVRASGYTVGRFVRGHVNILLSYREIPSLNNAVYNTIFIKRALSQKLSLF